MFKYVKFAELPVDDQDRALRFYTEKVGLKVIQDAPYQDGWRWIELEIPGAETRLMLAKRKDERKTDAPRLVLIAENANEAYQELSRKGVAFTTKPTPSPWQPGETFAQFRDSEGNGIVISSS